MNRTKKLLAAVLAAALLGICAGGVVWFFGNHVIVDLKAYPKDLEELDLRGQEVSPDQYDRLRKSLPNCRIRWSIPFQGSFYPQDTQSLTVTSLSAEDLAVLPYFESLKTVNAQACTDYENLTALAQSDPALTVNFSIRVGQDDCAWDTESLFVSALSGEDLERLNYFPRLSAVTLSGCDSQADALALQSWCGEHNVDFRLDLGGDVSLSGAETELTLTGVTDGQLNLLSLLPQLGQLHLVDPACSPQALFNLKTAYPQVEVSWSYQVWGTTLENGITSVDLSKGEPTSIQDLENALEYFPTVTEVYLGKCGLPNDDIAELRERQRGRYKVVWLVGFRDRMYVRSDTDNFFACPPNRPGVCNFNDEDAKNLIYLEDVVCMDIGHMPVHKVDFLKYMPKMEYLILSWTQVQSIEAVAYCKELKFLEVTDACLRSLEGIQECTKLEDLNFSNNWPDVTPLLGMTWLKNVHMIYGSSSDAYKISQALPDTKVTVSGDATVGGGWRRLPNYYKMRDLLGAPYMN